MPSYKSTVELVKGMNYFTSPSEFFSNFPSAWSNARKYIYKLETRQVYREPGNPSYDELEKGNFEKAVEILDEARQGDIELYNSLKERNVQFFRCRPILVPLTEYLRWELECYKFNSRYGEKILVSKTNAIYENYALHDFMVFDTNLAFVHDYDDKGEIRGGWLTRDNIKIAQLSNMFLDIKERSEYMSESKLV